MIHPLADCDYPGFLFLDKHHDQEASWGGKGLFGLHFYHCSSQKEVRTGTQAGQEPGGRSWCRGHRGGLLTGFLPMKVLSLLSYRTQDHQPGEEVVQPTVGWALPHQSLRKSTGLPVSSILSSVQGSPVCRRTAMSRGHKFIVLCPSFQDVL